MEIQYKPSKPKKEKSVKTPKAPKAEKAVKFNSSVQTVKTSKPAKASKAPKAPRPEKVKTITFGKPGKVQTDKPVKVEKTKKPGIFSKIDPKLILGGTLVLIVVLAVIVWTVVIPTVEKNGQMINSISITKLPDKLDYMVGEGPDYDGLRVQVTRNNGETFTVRADKCFITGFDSSVAMEGQPIKVVYEGKSATFSINIKEKPKPTPALKGISIEKLPDKTEYKLGEGLDTTGGIILCEFVDGSVLHVNLTNGNVAGFSAINAPGTYDLYVEYVDNGILATTTYTITVTG